MNPMNFEIVKIENQNGREVAYMFDKIKGTILKVLVEDQTGNMPYIPQRAMPIRTIDQDFNRAGFNSAGAGSGIGDEIVPDIFKRQLKNLPDKPKAAPPPPHLAGVFIPQGSPGEAIETRNV